MYTNIKSLQIDMQTLAKFDKIMDTIMKLIIIVCTSKNSTIIDNKFWFVEFIILQYIQLYSGKEIGYHILPNQRPSDFFQL